MRTRRWQAINAELPRLAVRRDRVTAELEGERRSATAEAGPNGAERGAITADHGRFLDKQARLPRRGAPDSAGRRRDYAGLAPLLGLGRAEYEQLAPGAQRSARLEIDRELAARREGRTSESGTSTQSVSERPLQTPRDGRVPRGAEASPETVRPERRHGEPDSDVWRDIREVEAGRKRQLGIGRP